MQLSLAGELPETAVNAWMTSFIFFTFFNFFNFYIWACSLPQEFWIVYKGFRYLLGVCMVQL